MTIYIVTKKRLDAVGYCAEGKKGVDWFADELGKGDPNFEMASDELQKAISSCDRPRDVKYLWSSFIEALGENVDFHIERGVVKMNEKYRVFNPTTAQYEECNSLSMAYDTRELIISEFIGANKKMFAISQEAVIQDEDRTMWKIIE